MNGWMDRLNFPIFQVVSDPVGYGFVIRGSRPVYVHTVDPSGPAASAGLQVSKKGTVPSLNSSLNYCYNINWLL